MVDAVSFGQLGSSIQSGEIDNEAVTLAKLDLDSMGVWELIDETELTSSAASISLTSLDTSAYDYLVLVYCLFKEDDNANERFALLQLNGATTGYYGNSLMAENGNTTSTNHSNAAGVYIARMTFATSGANYAVIGKCLIQNSGNYYHTYSGCGGNSKGVITYAGDGGGQTATGATQVTVARSATFNFAAGSYLRLYGVRVP